LSAFDHVEEQERTTYGTLAKVKEPILNKSNKLYLRVAREVKRQLDFALLRGIAIIKVYYRLGLLR